MELSHFSLKMMFCAIKVIAPKAKKKGKEEGKKEKRGKTRDEM